MKEYVKPELFYENFELSQHIAGCNLTLDSGDVMNCDASGTIGSDFVDGAGSKKGWFVTTNICGVEVESYCYTNGTHTLTTINS